MNNSVTQEGSYLEEKETIFWIASIISFTIHILIFAIAIYGLPNLGRELPENKELIIFDLVQIKDETNLDEIIDNEKSKEESSKKKDKPLIVEKKIPVPNPLIENIDQPLKKPLKSNIEEPLVKPVEINIENPQKKPLKIKQEDLISKPKLISKPLMKPQIVKKKNSEKIQKLSKTNPAALTSVLKTLEDVKETNKKIKDVNDKKKEAANNIKELVIKSQSNQKKDIFKETGISYKDNLNQHIKQFWNPPIGAAGAENLIVDIFLELNSSGKVLSAKWVNKGMNTNNAFYIAAANAAMRAVVDASPLPLPSEKYEEWRKMTLHFNPEIMFGGY